MDSRPIGVFDSGLGGLTTVKKLTEILPGEDIIYLGDTGRAPYGSRSRETIIKYAGQDAAFLAGFDIKAMVIACNSACSAAYGSLSSIWDMPIYDVINAPADTAAAHSKNGIIGVIGTSATIRSSVYETALKNIEPRFQVISIACPLFVPLVENGRIADDDMATLLIAEDYLSPLREAKADTLILGCTHYPLLRGVISKVVGSDVELIDSGAETAKAAAGDILARGIQSPGIAGGTARYFVTDSADGFSGLASRFLGSDVRGMVEQITLEQITLE